MRLIDANSAKEALECTLAGDAAALAQRVIDRMPTIDAVPVVRCRECKHSSLPAKITQIYGKEGTLTCHYGPCNRRNVSMNDFCSYGERKDGDGNG